MLFRSEVALVFGAGALGKVECGKSECGWHGGDAFGRASTIGAAGASNVEATAWRARCGAVCGGVSRDDSDAVPMVFFEAGLGSAVRSMESRRAVGLASGGAEIRAEIGTVTGSMACARRMVGFLACHVKATSWMKTWSAVERVNGRRQGAHAGIIGTGAGGRRGDGRSRDGCADPQTGKPCSGSCSRGILFA